MLRYIGFKRRIKSPKLNYSKLDELAAGMSKEIR